VKLVSDRQILDVAEEPKRQVSEPEPKFGIAAKQQKLYHSKNNNIKKKYTTLD
jgi:hypothetical protein